MERQSSQRRWVTKCLPQITTDFVLRRKVELLKELGRNGDASGCPDAIQCSASFVVFVEMLVACHIAIAIGEVFFERSAAVASGRGLERALVVHC